MIIARQEIEISITHKYEFSVHEGEEFVQIYDRSLPFGSRNVGSVWMNSCSRCLPTEVVEKAREFLHKCNPNLVK